MQPDEKFLYSIDRNERVNEMQKEAMNCMESIYQSFLYAKLTQLFRTASIRKIVLQRLAMLGLQTFRLPIGTEQHEKHVPVLISPDIAKKERVILLFPERNTDLGIFSYRTIGNDGISKGSAIGFFTTILDSARDGKEVPGIVVTNPGQLLWHQGGEQAISRTSWANLPRQTAVDVPFRIDEIKNKIPGNRDYEEHVKYVFEHIVQGMCKKYARIDIIGMEWTGLATLRYLAAHWDDYSSRIGGICLTSPQHNMEELGTGDFASFINRQCRVYLVSDEAIGSYIGGREEYGCDCIASGETQYPENIIVEGSDLMLGWLDQL